MYIYILLLLQTGLKVHKKEWILLILNTGMMQILALEIYKLWISRNQECVLCTTTILYMCFSHIPSQFATVQNNILWLMKNKNSDTISQHA